MMVYWSILILSSYLLGAIPFGFLLGKLRRLDIRGEGSGRIGATNVYRALGIKSGFVILLTDLAKGAGAVVIAKALFDNYWAEIVAALVAMIGHNWPVYLKFQGGRGVTTYFGALIALYWAAWPIGLANGLLTILIMAISRYASLGSLLGCLVSIIIMLSLVLQGREPYQYLVYTTLGSALIFFQHRDNIARLISGKERKLGLRKTSR